MQNYSLKLDKTFYAFVIISLIFFEQSLGQNQGPYGNNAYMPSSPSQQYPQDPYQYQQYYQDPYQSQQYSQDPYQSQQYYQDPYQYYQDPYQYQQYYQNPYEYQGNNWQQQPYNYQGNNWQQQQPYNDQYGNGGQYQHPPPPSWGNGYNMDQGNSMNDNQLDYIVVSAEVQITLPSYLNQIAQYNPNGVLGATAATSSTISVQALFVYNAGIISNPNTLSGASLTFDPQVVQQLANTQIPLINCAVTPSGSSTPVVIQVYIEGVGQNYMEELQAATGIVESIGNAENLENFLSNLS